MCQAAGLAQLPKMPSTVELHEWVKYGLKAPALSPGYAAVAGMGDRGN